ncbi:FAD-dependent oxidoreductase [Pseudoramibacter alactolyticus]|uniref:oxidoreductase n=1 Tax=Pseudoramibacter alactolyticus TaxID=113287 RepID=UPI0028EDEBC2|nr:FAD-dependent oxidoreductase [Pseudoramibacter alactolyticus]
MQYPKLFEKGQIGKLKLKNRIVMPAMGTGFASATGEASEELIRYMAERARGGAGLMITEVTRVDELSGIAQPAQLCATDMKFITSLSRLTDAVHAYDAKIFMQLQHPGNQTPSMLLHGNPVIAPSPVACKTTNEVPKAMTTAEVEAMTKNFIKAAVIAKTAGFDGVEIHGAHGYLVNQFLSPYTNRRTDQYGGDFFNRMRFLTEIVVGIKYTCGPDFPISVRLDGTEFTPYGMDEAECAKIARYTETLGVACLNISCGTYESGWSIIEPYAYQEGWKKHLAANIRKEVDIPVIAVNTIKHPAFAEQMLEEGVSDFVAIGRGLLCDLDWPEKARRGKDDRIRKCIGCMNCFRTAAAGRPVECAVNPILGREAHYGEDQLKKDGAGRVVAVIGSGPAGMQAAVVLAKRGFKPVIFEKEAQVGGMLNLADKPPYKGMVGELIETMKHELEDLNVEIRLNTSGTVDACQEIGACGVVLAAGGNDIEPSIAGFEKGISYQKILTKEVVLSEKKIAVIGGGLVGLETAAYLGEAGNKVTVIEMLNKVGGDIYSSVTQSIVSHIEKTGGNIVTGHALKSINENGDVTLSVVETAFDKPNHYDAVVLALGSEEQPDIVDAYEKVFDKVVCVGDAEKKGNIADATHAAYSKAFVF